MPQSLSAVYVHGIFSTKERRPYFREAAIRAAMHSYIAGISKQLHCPPIIVGGTEVHVHQLVRLGRTVTQGDWIKETKRSSNNWVKENAGLRIPFSWQAGYAVFSVSTSVLNIVEQYIANQEKHHRRVSFQDELRILLKEHGLEWDERYLWE